MGIKQFAKKNWFGLASLGLSVAILIVFLVRAGGVFVLAATVADMDKKWLSATVGCTVLYWLADGVILHRYIKIKYKKHSFLRSLKTTMVGFLYNCLTPFASGGQPMQVYDMSKSGIDAGDAVSYVTVKAIVYQVCLTVYVVVALFFSLGFFTVRIPHFMVLLWFGMIVNAIFLGIIIAIAVNKKAATKICLMLINLLTRLRFIRNHEKRKESLLRHINLFNESFMLIYQKKGEMIFTFLATIAQLTLYYSVPYLIYRGFNLSGSAFYLILSAQAILTLITAFVPLPGGSGVAETGFYVFFNLFFSSGVIVPAVMIWRILTYYACILAGGAASLWGMRKKRVSFLT